MSKIILDISANTHKNSLAYIVRMIDEIKAIDKGKHEVIFKHQLFTEAGKNIPLNPNVFDDAIWYAKEKGYQTTSSVFDKENLHLLLQYEIPFVKIANRRDLDYLIGEVPRKIPVYVSKGEMPYMSDWRQRDIVTMACVSHYPATLAEYEEAFYPFQLRHAVSDHTVGLGLWHKYHPDIIEMHYRLEDSTGLDAGPFAKTPAELRGVIG